MKYTGICIHIIISSLGKCYKDVTASVITSFKEVKIKDIE